MATNPYEVEHNIKAPTSKPHARRPDMSTFYSRLHEISPESTASSSAPAQAANHLGPTPVDAASLFELLRSQFATLQASAPPPSEGNNNNNSRDLLQELMGLLDHDIHAPPDRIRGVSQEYLDTALDRVPKRQLKKDDSCPICAEPFLDDPYPLVVTLPCKGGQGKHRFDLECVGPWLLSKGTCPMCRDDLTAKKVVDVPVDDEEQDEIDGLYG